MSLIIKATDHDINPLIIKPANRNIQPFYVNINSEFLLSGFGRCETDLTIASQFEGDADENSK